MVTAADLNEQIRDQFTAFASHLHNGSAGEGSISVGPVNSVTFKNHQAQPGNNGTLVRNDGGGGDPNGLLQWKLPDGSFINIHSTQSDGPATEPRMRSLGNTGTQGTSGTHTH